jgi:hypothetical protein
MKKNLFILITFLITASAFSQVNNCCPKFSLKQMGDVLPCEGDSTCVKDPLHGGGNPGNGPSVQTITACKNSAQTYYVFPNLPGFTFTWTVVGGTHGAMVHRVYYRLSLQIQAGTAGIQLPGKCVCSTLL